MQKRAKVFISGALLIGGATYPWDDVYLRGKWTGHSWSNDRFDNFHVGSVTEDWRSEERAMREIELLYSQYWATIRAPDNNSVSSSLYLVRGISLIGLELGGREELTPCMQPEEVSIIWNQLKKQRIERMWPWWRAILKPE